MKRKPSIYELRSSICGIDCKVPLINGQPVTGINFDNAATTPPFNYVLQEIMNFAPWYSSIHRGTGYKSMLSSKIYDDSREIIANFIGCDLKENCVVFVKNTTEALNKISCKLCQCYEKCIILSTGMEHHSNDLPWRNKYHIEYIETDEYGRLSIDDLEERLINYNGAVKLVTVTGASNATGYLNPIHDIAKLAHKYGAKILVDGAQLVPHKKINMKANSAEDHIDFLVFSAHKMYAPFGIGVLAGSKETFEKGYPDYMGGGTVQLVTHDYVMWDTPPEKDEPGSPNLIGVVALVAAIKMLMQIGMDIIDENEQELTNYTLSELKKIDDVELYTCTEFKTPRVGIIPFNIKNMPHSITAKILSYEGGIAVRNGCFCAQPYLQKILNVTPEKISHYLSNNYLPPYGVVRISFGLYNSKSEVDRFLDMLRHIIKNKEKYLQKYTPTPISIENSTITYNEYDPSKGYY